MQWVKGADRVPTDHSRYFIKIEGTMSIGHWSKHHEMFINESNDFFPEDQVEWLDESIPASAEDEAVRMYPDDGDDSTERLCNAAARSAHITCAGMYTGEISRLTDENHKLMMENDTVSEELGETRGLLEACKRGNELLGVEIDKLKAENSKMVNKDQVKELFMHFCLYKNNGGEKEFNDWLDAPPIHQKHFQ